jgi:mono/diheme cytochrome c family protein
MFKKYCIALLIAPVLLVSCIRSAQKPGRAYMPDMQYSTPYDAGSENPVFRDGKTNQFAPKGSIARGKYIYHIPNTPEGYEASASLTNPFTFSKEEIEGTGKHLFNVNCAICHGEKGDGQGHLVEINKFPQPPSYFTDDLRSKPDGKRYHTLMYGKGMMGSYASQLNHRERWLVLSYVRALQDANKPAAATTASAEAPKQETK